MQLYKRGQSSFWWYSFNIDGETVRASTKRPLTDKAGAKRFMASEYERLMNVGQFGQKPETTLAEAFDRVIAQVRSVEKTRLSYELVKRKFLGLDRWADPAWYSLDGKMSLSRLNDGHLADMVTERVQEGYANNSINIELRVIKRTVNGSKKRFAANHDLTYPMLKHFEKTRFLSRDEEEAISALLLANKGSPAYDKAWELMIFLIDTGVRLSEGLNISWPEINALSKNAEVYRTKTNSLSIIPMSDRLLEMLERKRNQGQPFVEMTRAVRLLRSSISEVANGNDRVNAQRGRATIHSLRDTYASRMAAKGMSLHKIAKLLGHTTTTMTRKYAQLETQDVAEEARMFLNG